MEPRLQVLIVTKGMAGLKRIASLPHPATEGVEYIVSWQEADMARIPESLRGRTDFKIFPSASNGISNNRNDAFAHATAPHVLISDDDLSYSEQNLKNVMEAFDTYPDASVLTFKYDSDDYPKAYPDHEFSLNGKMPRGYYFTSFEIAFNLEAIKKRDKNLSVLKFNPNFGINGRLFGAGEEEILLTKLLRRRHIGRFLPREIAYHAGATTGMRDAAKREFIENKGACMLYVKPRTWFLRMLTHAWRAHRTHGDGHINFFNYCGLWLSGARKAVKENAFEGD